MRLGPAILVSALLASTPALAEEIVYLTSGSAMPARGHEFKGDMIHVDLGGDSFIAFPIAMVDRIEDANGIELTPSRANVIQSGPPNPNGSFPARGLSAAHGPRERAAQEADPHIRVDPRTGLAGYVEDPSQGDRSTVFTGRRELLGLPSSDAYRGTSRMGDKFVIQGGPRTRPQTVGIRMKTTATYPPVAETPPDPATPPPDDGQNPQAEPDPGE